MPTPHEVTKIGLLSNCHVFTITSSLWPSICLFTTAAFLNMPAVKIYIRGVSGLWLLMSSAVIHVTKMHPQNQLFLREGEI